MRKEIEISKVQDAEGTYVVSIHNYNQITSWKSYKEYNRFFDTEKDADNAISKMVKRYKNQGFMEKHYCHLSNFVYLVDAEC